MTIYLFDVDGTLTPSREKIDYQFSIFLTNFFMNNDCYLVTGSDKRRTQEQIGQLYFYSIRNFQCSGNQIFDKDNLLRQSAWSCPDNLREDLEGYLEKSKFPHRFRTGYHIEERPGSLNYSILGRKATKEQRKEYILWDKSTGERDNIASFINRRHPNISAVVGGETGLDIFPKGKDKQQVLDYLPKDREIHFFGDMIRVGGNDFSLAMAIERQNRGRYYEVTSWENTRDILEGINSSSVSNNTTMVNF